MTKLGELAEQALEEIVQPELDVNRFIMSSPLAADEHPAAVFVALLSKKNTSKSIAMLNKIAKFFTSDKLDAVVFAWGNLRYQHAMAFRAKMQEVYSPGYVNLMLGQIRGVSKHAWQLGHMSAEDYQRIRVVRNIAHNDDTVGRSVSTKEISRLFTSFPDTEIGDRDRAILALLYGCGLRRGEICGLRLKDYDKGLKRLRVARKKGRVQYVYLSKGVQIALDKWMAYDGKILEDLGPMFYSLTNLEVNEEPVRPLCSDSIWRITKKAIKNSGIEGFTPHDLRRTYCTNLLSNGVDISIVQKLMGHKSINTTVRYDKRGEVEKQEAVAHLDDIPVLF